MELLTRFSGCDSVEKHFHERSAELQIHCAMLWSHGMPGRRDDKGKGGVFSQHC